MNDGDDDDDDVNHDSNHQYRRFPLAPQQQLHQLQHDPYYYQQQQQQQQEIYEHDDQQQQPHQYHDQQQQHFRLNKSTNHHHNILLLCKYPGCLKEFTSRWSLTRHLKIHSGIKSFKCNQCNKQFIQKCSLIRHEQIHLEEKPWICDYINCEKRFKLKEYLDIHKKSHNLHTIGRSGSINVDGGVIDGVTTSDDAVVFIGGSSNGSNCVGLTDGVNISIDGVNFGNDGSSSSSTSSSSQIVDDSTSDGGIMNNNSGDVDQVQSYKADSTPQDNQQRLNQLKNELVAMSIQHYQHIYHQEEREQELVASLQEISIALEGFIARLKNYRSMEDIPIELIVTLIEAKKICSHLA